MKTMPNTSSKLRFDPDLENKAKEHKELVDQIHSNIATTKQVNESWGQRVSDIKRRFSEIDEALDSILQTLLDQQPK